MTLLNVENNKQKRPFFDSKNNIQNIPWIYEKHSIL